MYKKVKKHCLNCGKLFTGHPNRKFCRNKGRGNCKDNYHNKRKFQRTGMISDYGARMLGYIDGDDWYEEQGGHYDQTNYSDGEGWTRG